MPMARRAGVLGFLGVGRDESKPMYAKKMMAAPASIPMGAPLASVWPATWWPKMLMPVQP